MATEAENGARKLIAKWAVQGGKGLSLGDSPGLAAIAIKATIAGLQGQVLPQKISVPIPAADDATLKDGENYYSKLSDNFFTPNEFPPCGVNISSVKIMNESESDLKIAPMSASRIVLAFFFVGARARRVSPRSLPVGVRAAAEGARMQAGEAGRELPRRRATSCTRRRPARPQMRGWEACLVSLPANQWQCSNTGQPVPQDAACQDARAGVVACISKFPEWPLPKAPPGPPKN